MRYSILFIVVLICVSGFIAYFGDVLGRWMGKKRLTLVNLRPRHTAYIVTAITGMLITALVLTTLLSVDKQFRRIFTEGDQILARNKLLSKSNVRLASDIKTLVNRRNELEAQVAKQKKEVDEAQEAALKAGEATAKAAKTVQHLETEIAARKREVEARKRELANLRKTSAQIEKELAGVQARLAKAQQVLARAQENFTSAQSKLIETNNKLRTAEAQLKKVEIAFEEQEKLLAERDEMLRAQHASLVAEGKKSLTYQSQRDELRNKEMILRQGDEIVRGVISPRQSAFGIRGDIYSLLQSASQKAAKLGAAVGSNGRAVFIDGEASWVDTARDEIAKNSLGNDTLVQVVCAENSLAGEQAPVKLLLYVNNLVYRKGDKIAGARMDGRISEGRVLLSVIDFLQKTVSIAGLQAGVVPIANPDSRANTATNPRSQVEGLMAVVDQITSKKGLVNVEVYACADVYAEGPLNMNNMRFSVTKVE